MTLSPRVGQASKSLTPLPQDIPRTSNGPFGGMNRRSAQLDRTPKPRSASQLKRSGRAFKPEKKPDIKTNANTFHALKMQSALASVSYRQRGNVKSSISETVSFDQFHLLPAIKQAIRTEALPGLEEIVPTPIQRIAIPAFLEQADKRQLPLTAEDSRPSRQFLIAAETGSGKTLAYLLPVLDAMKRAEAVDAAREANHHTESARRRQTDPTFVEPPPLHDLPHAAAGRPRAIILLPTSELVNQVSHLAKALSHRLKFRSRAISSALTPTVIRNRLLAPQGVDLLIATPSLLASIAESEPNILARVTHLVVDEADSLMDRSFAPITTTLIAKCASSLRQLVLCSATVPRSLEAFLRSHYPNMERLVTPNLHAIPRRVQLGVVDVEKDPYKGNKLLACADTIWSIGKTSVDAATIAQVPEIHDDTNPVKRILVFVNQREKTQEVAEYLQSKGIDASALSRDTPEERQSELLSSFTNAQSPSQAATNASPAALPTASPAAPPAATKDSLPYESAATPMRRSLPSTKVLVTTDLSSRGIDTTAVRHVILYDVPYSTIDFIHRLGRTGRMGRRGRGIILVGKGDRRDVVREVREGMYRGMALV